MVTERFMGYDRMVKVVGRRHAGCTFSNFECGDDQWTARRRYVLEKASGWAERISENLETGRNLVLAGTCGTGKDHLAAASIRVALSLGISCVFVRGCDLYAEMLGCSRDVGELSSRYRERELLVVSDIEPSSTQASEFIQWGIYGLLDARYRAMRPTVVTTNLTSRDDFARVIGERTVDRLQENAVILKLAWPSRRQEGASRG